MSPEARARLLAWYRESKRDLPWRRTADPYAILVSEAMLQQTRVQAVIPYFARWMERFPDLRTLAEADEQDVLALWQGLGYYRRARNLRQVAQACPDGLPGTAEGLRNLPGIGPYTAAAVASIAYGEAVPLADGNVERVAARLEAWRDSGPVLHRRAWEWAGENLVEDAPGDWNQALMELGATICTPRSPRCGECPLASECRATRLDNPEAFPVPAPRRAKVDLERWVVVPVEGDAVGVEPIPAGEWWAGLWRFPTFDQAPDGFEEVATVKATVTHHRIVFRVGLGSFPEGLRRLAKSDLESLAMPAPYRKMAERLFEQNLFSDS